MPAAIMSACIALTTAFTSAWWPDIELRNIDGLAATESRCARSPGSIGMAVSSGFGWVAGPDELVAVESGTAPCPGAPLQAQAASTTKRRAPFVR